PSGRPRTPAAAAARANAAARSGHDPRSTPATRRSAEAAQREASPPDPSSGCTAASFLPNGADEVTTAETHRTLTRSGTGVEPAYRRATTAHWFLRTLNGGRQRAEPAAGDQ